MRKICFGISLLAVATLMAELLLTRVFDVILYPNIGYMIITGAMFSFGLAGIWATLRPLPQDVDIGWRLALLSVAFAVSLIALRPAINFIPFEYSAIAEQPGAQAMYFLGMYFVITVPFFLAGLAFTRAFAHFAKHIQTLYFWDLAGAALGCVVIVPLLPSLGPGGLLFWAAALGCVAAVLFAPAAARRSRAAATVAAIGCVLAPAIYLPEYADFREHKSDRGLQAARRRGLSEYTRWDPISKVEVIELGPSKNIVYDGGSQSSFIYPFTGNYERLRRQLDRAVRQNDEPTFLRNFWQRGVTVSHYLKRDSDQRVLVIGSAAGQEVKAALTYGAGHVDGVEMVGSVVELGKTRYAHYNGGVLNDPRANVVRGEGRGFLRSSGGGYDIIQIFSNHSSSSVAAGVGAMDPTYLLTADAFVEYFEGLTDDGILHVNHHTYPRIVTTAALAWQWMGREDFQRHVFVAAKANDPRDSLPTVLIKMSPWTRDEMIELRTFFSLRDPEGAHFKIEENPLRPAQSFLSSGFYSGELPPELVDRVQFRVIPATDDRPYFKFLRKTFDTVTPSAEDFMWPETAHRLNLWLEQGGGLPIDILHLLVTGAVSILFAFAFILVPLFFSRVGRERWPGKASTLIYFSCLGAGFIIIELVLIQKFMRFIGYPLYTYSTVLFVMLLAAGAGSLASAKLRIRPELPSWVVPFVGVVAYGVVFLLAHAALFDALLFLPASLRIAVSAIMIFPVGFLLGMPFPLGVLAVENVSRSAVAWAWGMNGLFTVIGGLASVGLSIYLGFTVALAIALAIYVVAAVAFTRMRRLATAS